KKAPLNLIERGLFICGRRYRNLIDFTTNRFSTFAEIINFSENSRQISLLWLFSALVENGEINERVRNPLKGCPAKSPEQSADPQD
ncbi:hypothetical protein, partial [Pseudomonas sp. FH1]|uniref:hypothetical protein n=1 Tax=Pseudomonas sp. FH1 TaxID=1284392 RepID=UPI0019D37AEC